MPLPIRLNSDVACQLIESNVLPYFNVVELAAGDYRALLNDAAVYDTRGGAIYDAIIARAAEKTEADQLLTLNPDDFRRVWPDGADRVITPLWLPLKVQSIAGRTPPPLDRSPECDEPTADSAPETPHRARRPSPAPKSGSPAGSAARRCIGAEQRPS